jgi:hypothetical protein
MGKSPRTEYIMIYNSPMRFLASENGLITVYLQVMAVFSKRKWYNKPALFWYPTLNGKPGLRLLF